MLKAPYRVVVELAERLSCGHYVALRKLFRLSGYQNVYLHLKRRCPSCCVPPQRDRGPAARRPGPTIEQLDAGLALIFKEGRRPKEARS